MSTVSTERPDDADAPAGAPVIELRGITKRFPGVVANSRRQPRRAAGARCTPSSARTAPASPP